MLPLDYQMELELEQIYVNSSNSPSILMMICLNKSFHLLFLELWIDFIICQMHVLSMTPRRNFGYTYILIEAMSIQDGETMGKSIQKKIQQKRRKQPID